MNTTLVRRALMPLLLAASLLVVAPTLARAQSLDELFDPGTLREIRLSINTRDLQQMRATYLENTYYPAELEWGGLRLSNVGVRSRGMGSRNPVKLGFKIDADRFVTNQRILGLKTLVLDNLWQDPALIRESVTMALFARLGQAAPREAYVRLYVNGEYEGLYAVVEPINGAFISRYFGDATGYLFEYKWLRPFYGEYLGSALAPYAALFEPETHNSDGDVALYSSIERMWREINAPDDAIWRESVDRYVNLEQFVTHAAIETFVNEWDGILGYAGMNNFYLYRPSGSERHQFLPWDRDNAFQEIDASVLRRVDENVLLRRALAYPDLRALYLQVLENCARTSTQGGWLENEVVWRASLIGAAVREDQRKQFSNEEFDQGIDYLRTFARNRTAIVLSEVDKLRSQN